MLAGWLLAPCHVVSDQLAVQGRTGGPRLGPRSSRARSCIGTKCTQRSSPCRRPKPSAVHQDAPANFPGLDTQLSRVRSHAQSGINLHGRHCPFSLMHHCDCTVGHKKFKVAARLALKAAAVVQREVVTVACQVCQDIAPLAFAEAELAKTSAREESRGQWRTWTAKGLKAEPSWLTR